MKTAGAGLIALLDSQLFSMADLYTFVLADATVLRYTSADGDIEYPAGTTFSSVGPLLKRGKIRAMIGVEVDTLEVTFLVNSGVEINSIPIAQFARQGGFDGATMALWRAFMPNDDYGNTTAGVLVQFLGRMAEVEPTRTSVTLHVNSTLELLNVMLPKNLYQANCVHTLYDAECGIVKAAWTDSRTVLAGSTAISISFTSGADPYLTTNYFDQGAVIFTSGALSGISRSIRLYTAAAPNVIALSAPFPEAPAAGDTFDMYPSCERTMAFCTSRYNNIAQFRGFPFIPIPETSY